MLSINRQTPLPFYEQIKTSLRQQIDRGVLKPDAIIPDERSLAAQLGISRMTVRRAIMELTKEGLLHRIRGKGTFVRGAFAPQPRRSRSAIALVSTFDRLERGASRSPFYNGILHGIYDASEKAGLWLAYRKITPPLDAFIAALRNDTTLKGIIALGIGDPALIHALNATRLPVVLLDSVQPGDHPAFDEVNHIGEGAVTSAVHSLLRLGHTDIGLMIPAKPSAFFQQRQAGFETALKNFNVPFRKERLYNVYTCPLASYALMRRILQSGDVPTAMVCTADEMAVGVMSAVNDFGWKVPRDVSVIGFGDLGYFTSPFLSTISVPCEQMGLEAVRVIEARLQNPTAPIQRVLLPTNFLQRASCDYPRTVTAPKS
jgi:DNA-binding LacI/PurR family transcriptional regulator